MSKTGPVARTDSSYDDVPYESSSFPQTHPDRLATLAKLFGLTPAPVDRCNVLELGCAMGANLVPMAFNLPDSRFVGVDLSARQVADARASASEMGLTNIRIEHASILDIDESWGRFDYLICHGVFSWVPRQVQDKILAIAANNLTPHGVAFISYNTYPGWHIREMVRHMMRYHAGQFEHIPERIEQARALLDFLAGSVDAATYYGALLNEELQLVHRVRDSYLFHEHLEEVNEPVYFHEFIGRAALHGLQYLADAEFSTMTTRDLPPESADTLQRISPDIVRAEQYMDFVRNRLFRQTLLCGSTHEVRRQLSASDLNGLMLASAVMPDSSGDGSGYRTRDGRRVATPFPLTHAALAVLSEHWPSGLQLEALRARACERLGVADEAQLDQDWAVVLDDMLHCYASGAVELRAWQAPLTHQVSSTPLVSRLVAQQVRHAPLVTSQRHEAVSLDVVGRCLAPLLDGTRDRAALIAGLLDRIADREITLEQDGNDINDEALSHEALATVTDETLTSFARRALLVR
jgi:methyltransferase-like protein/SAM-dependent methyltransferase